MENLIRQLSADQIGQEGSCGWLEREWLVTNGLGGYASGTIIGAATRRYHGLLIAALPAPLGQRMMLNHLFENLRFPDMTSVQFGGEERVGAPAGLYGAKYLDSSQAQALLALPVA